jgi:hypothetical protein
MIGALKGGQTMHFRSTAFACAIAALCIAFSASAMAAGGTRNFVSKPLRVKGEEAKGCIAGTMGRSRSPGMDNSYFAFSLRFSRDPDAAIPRPASFQVDWDGKEGGIFFLPHAQLQDAEESRDPFLVCVPPGKYRFRTNEIKQGLTIFSLPDDYDLPFDVVAGQTTYIGSFVVYTPYQSVDPCASNRGLLRVVALDRSSTDLDALKSMKKVTNPYPVKVAPAVLASIWQTLVTCPFPEFVASTPKDAR